MALRHTAVSGVVTSPKFAPPPTTFAAHDHHQFGISSSCSSAISSGRSHLGNENGTAAPHTALAPMAAFLFLLVVGPTLLGEGDGEYLSEPDQLPSRIVPYEELPDMPGGYLKRPPALRGCCGEPAEFRWVFPTNKGATAGAPFRTRVLALDAQGRQARPSACGALSVHLGLSGSRARLSPATSPPRWRGSELQLDIESEAAELVEAEVRIASPDPSADVLLHTSQIRFASGPAHELLVRVRHGSREVQMQQDWDDEDDGDEDWESISASTWETGTELEVVVSVRDRFGNRVPLTNTTAGWNGGLLGYGASGVALQASSAGAALEVKPNDGFLTIDSVGAGRCMIRGTRSGTSEIWLAPTGGNATAQQRLELREQTTRMVRFADTVVEGAAGATLSAKDERWQPVAQEAKDAFLHAWRGYKRHAWGRDELQPISRKGRDSFGGVGMTILDSMTTLWLMNLTDEFEEACTFVERDLRFDASREDVSVFELIIRALGGLLGAHALSGKKVLLERARDLGARLLPALNTSTKLPLPKFNLAKGTGKATGEPTILAEAGSLQLEYRYLGAQTGEQRFTEAADAAFAAIQSTGVSGLIPVYLTPPEHTPVRVLASKFALGALADSYYEYLLKQWLQTPSDVQFKKMWLSVVDELPSLVMPNPREKGTKTTKYKLLEVKPNGERIWKMDHLSCFTPAMIVLGLRTLPRSDLRENGRNTTLWRLAEGITESCVSLWTSSRSGLAPEFAHVESSSPHGFEGVPAAGRHSFLRPETVESLFYLYRFTGDEKYRHQGEKIFRAILQHAKVDAGFASVQDVTVTPTAKLDEMQSFVMAETFKYLYLLFSPAHALDLDHWVLNTEGHPLPRGRRRR